GRAQASLGRGATFSRRGRFRAAPSHGGDRAVRTDLPNAGVKAISNEEIAGRIHNQTEGSVHRGLDRGAVVSGAADFSRAHDGQDRARRWGRRSGGRACDEAEERRECQNSSAGKSVTSVHQVLLLWVLAAAP